MMNEPETFIGLRQVDAVVVGASAGGVEALLTIFADLRQGFRQIEKCPQIESCQGLALLP